MPAVVLSRKENVESAVTSAMLDRVFELLSPSVIYVVGKQRCRMCRTASTHEIIESQPLNRPLGQSWCSPSFKRSYSVRHTPHEVY